MPTLIKTDGDYAVELSTYIITIDFLDQDGNPVIPTTATWTLTDTSASVINSREDVVISGLASSVDVVLSGDDLALQSGETGDYHERLITVEATYDSLAGAGLALKDELTFPLYNLTAIS